MQFFELSLILKKKLVIYNLQNYNLIIIIINNS